MNRLRTDFPQLAPTTVFTVVGAIQPIAAAKLPDIEAYGRVLEAEARLRLTPQQAKGPAFRPGPA